MSGFRSSPRSSQRAHLIFRGMLSLGPLGGVELRLHLGWVPTFLFTTWLMAMLVLPAFFPGWDPEDYWLVGLGVAVVENLAGVLHELGHAIVALAHGHTVHGITLYGFTAVARRSTGRGIPIEQLRIALAGPAIHFLLAGALWATLHLMPQESPQLRVLLGLPVVTNLTMGVLNLLPLTPLDGGRALRAAIAALTGS